MIVEKILNNNVVVAIDPNTKKEEFGYRRFDNYVVFKKEGKIKYI